MDKTKEITSIHWFAYPLFDPIETSHSETKVENDERKSHHQNGKVAGHSLGNALHVTINQKEKLQIWVNNDCEQHFRL